MATIVVSGAVANKYLKGGEAWVRLSWIRGFAELGFRVVFIEEIARDSCVDSSGCTVDVERSLNFTCFMRVVDEFALDGLAALVIRGKPDEPMQSFGLGMPELLDIAEDAVALINISGNLRSDPLFSRFAKRVYIDIDPGFTQIWHQQGVADLGLERHHDHFTIGENIGTLKCSIPTDNIRWRPVRQPIVLSDWPVCLDNSKDISFSTISTWRGSFGRLEHLGRTFGLKAHQFRQVIELPRNVPGRFEIALDIDPGDERDRQALVEHGWHLVDPEVAASPMSFRDYISSSGAEFSVAQGVYTDTSSGWFSDRSIRYLACGKPVLVQETGFPAGTSGEGLVTFANLDDAVAGATRIMSHPDSHREAARALAQDLFDANKVLGRLVEEIGVRP